DAGGIARQRLRADRIDHVAGPPKSAIHDLGPSLAAEAQAAQGATTKAWTTTPRRSDAARRCASADPTMGEVMNRTLKRLFSRPRGSCATALAVVPACRSPAPTARDPAAQPAHRTEKKARVPFPTSPAHRASGRPSGSRR